MIEENNNEQNEVTTPATVTTTAIEDYSEFYLLPYLNVVVSNGHVPNFGTGEVEMYSAEQVDEARKELKRRLDDLKRTYDWYLQVLTGDPLVVFPQYIRDRVRAMLDQAVAAGYLNEKYQLTKGFGKERAGVLAHHITENLDLSRPWKCFEQLWNVKYLRQNWKNYSKTKAGKYFSLIVQNEIG